MEIYQSRWLVKSEDFRYVKNCRKGAPFIKVLLADILYLASVSHLSNSHLSCQHEGADLHRSVPETTIPQPSDMK